MKGAFALVRAIVAGVPLPLMAVRVGLGPFAAASGRLSGGQDTADTLVWTAIGEAVATSMKEAPLLRRVDLRAATEDPRALLPRAALDVEAAVEAVRPICEAVRERGVAAIAELARRFDGVELTDLRVPAAALADALARLDPAVRAALEEAIRRTRTVHEAQRRSDHVVRVAPGGQVTERWVPVRRVGLYVPGGLVAYPSSVVMNVVPAQVAGVTSLAVASPPQADNGSLPHPVVLAACALLGVDEVYAVGGAQAIAMFAYGIPGEVEPVDMVTGPGNIYVAAAKRLLKGIIGIDAEAGPTEIAILADSSADPRYVAADLPPRPSTMSWPRACWSPTHPSWLPQ